MKTKNLGAVTAYADAVKQGYKGTREEFGTVMANFADSAAQVAADAKEIRETKENIEGMKSNVQALQEQAAESAQAAEQSKTEAAGYADAAEVSRQAAAESEANVNARATGFEEQVTVKTEEAESDITTAKEAAVAAITKQQTDSIQAIKDQSETEQEKLETYSNQAKTAAENAAQSEQAAKIAEEAAESVKTAAETAKSQAEQAATKTAEDRTAVETARETITQTAQEVADNKAAIDQATQNFNLTYQQAVKDVNDAGKTQTERVQEAGNSTLNDIGTSKDNALSAINAAGETQTNAVNDAGAAQSKAINDAGAAKTEAINTAGSTQVSAITKEGEMQVSNVQEAAAEIIADRDQIELNRQNLLKTAIKRSASGKTITLSDSAEMPFVGMRQYGHTTQNGIPTPENPVELVSAGNKGNIETRVTGKNLIMFPYVSNFETLNGITYAISDDGVVTAGGTTDSGTNFNLCSGLTLHPGTYTLSGMNEFSGMNLLVYDSDKKLVLCILEAGEESAMFTVDKKYSFVMVYLNVGKAGVKVEGKAYPMLQHGTESTAYEPYKAQPLTMLTPNGLPGIPVSSGGNYTDENGQQWVADYRDWERGVDVKRIGTVKDKISNLNIVRSDKNLFSMTADNFKLKAKILCNVLKNGNTVKDNHTISSARGDALRAYFRIEEADSLEDLKNIYGEIEMILHYELATPIETPIPPEELAAYHALHTNHPNTTICNDEDVWMEVEYGIDTEASIDAKVQESNIMTDATTGKKYILGMKDGLLTVYEVIE